MRTVVGLLLVVALIVPAMSGGFTASVGAANETPAEPVEPRIVDIYANPVLVNDRGEYVVIEVPAGTDLGPLALTDGETTLDLPDREATGRVAVATDPVARNLTDDAVMLVNGPFQLTNEGEWVELRDGDDVLDTVTYPPPPEGELYRLTADGWAWHRPGATAFPVRSARASSARLFVLPDATEAAFEPLRSAERRLWLAAYEFTSSRVAEALCDARGRGVDVRVLAERDPVGGMATAQATVLDRLLDCDVSVRVIGGPRARYNFHHAKYAIADDRAVVLTENWKPSGVGGRSSRGWGAVVKGEDPVGALAGTFEADAGWQDARPWAAVRSDRSDYRTGPPADGRYEPAFEPAEVGPLDVEVVAAPDNAEDRVVDLLDGAETSIQVIQVSVPGPGQPFVRALLRAARRGVSVQLLLADVWYVRDENRAVATTLDERARAEGLPLEVRLASPQGRYGKIHAKGAVVDGDRVLLGSLNWNNVSARQNREVALVLHGEEAGAYYSRVFRADWRGGRWQVPAGLIGVVVAVAAAATAFARRQLVFDPSMAPAVLPDEERGLY